MILSKVLPLTANSPYLISYFAFLLTIVLRLIHNGIPDMIYKITEPRLQISITHD